MQQEQKGTEGKKKPYDRYINIQRLWIFKAFSKKLRGSHGLHLWTDHSSIVQVGDMQEACPLISLAEDHCPLTFIREIRSSMPTKVSGKFEGLSIFICMCYVCRILNLKFWNKIFSFSSFFRSLNYHLKRLKWR